MIIYLAFLRIDGSLFPFLDALAKSLKVIHPLLVQLHKSHTGDMAAISAELKTGRIRRSQKVVLFERGKQLKQRQFKLVGIYRTHKKLTDVLKEKATKLISVKEDGKLLRSEDISASPGRINHSALAAPNIAAQPKEKPVTSPADLLDKLSHLEQPQPKHALIQLDEKMAGTSMGLSRLRTDNTPENTTTNHTNIEVEQTQTQNTTTLPESPVHLVGNSNLIILSSPESKTSKNKLSSFTQKTSTAMKRKFSQDDSPDNKVKQTDDDSSVVKSTKQKRPLFSTPFKVNDPVCASVVIAGTNTGSPVISSQQHIAVPMSPVWSKTIRHMKDKLVKQSPVGASKLLIPAAPAGCSFKSSLVKTSTDDDNVKLLKQVTSASPGTLISPVVSPSSVRIIMPISSRTVQTGISSATIQAPISIALQNTTRVCPIRNSTPSSVTLVPSTDQAVKIVHSLPSSVITKCIPTPPPVRVFMLSPNTTVRCPTTSSVVSSQSRTNTISLLGSTLGKNRTPQPKNQSAATAVRVTSVRAPLHPEWTKKLPPGPTTPSLAPSSPDIPHTLQPGAHMSHYSNK